MAKKNLISRLDVLVSTIISFNRSNNTEVAHFEMDVLLSRKGPLILILITLSVFYLKIWVIMFFLLINLAI